MEEKAKRVVRRLTIDEKIAKAQAKVDKIKGELAEAEAKVQQLQDEKDNARYDALVAKVKKSGKSIEEIEAFLDA